MTHRIAPDLAEVLPLLKEDTYVHVNIEALFGREGEKKIIAYLDENELRASYLKGITAHVTPKHIRELCDIPFVKSVSPAPREEQYHM